MPFVITTKGGIPLKLTDRNLIKPAVSPVTIKSPVPIPASSPKVYPVGLSKPEGPTTTNIRQMEANIPMRHSVLYERIVDRGGSLPFLGRVAALPDGGVGGTRNRIKPVLLDVAAATKNLVPANSRLAQKLQSVIRKTAVIQSAAVKRVVPRIFPGAGALDFAKATRRFRDAHTGELKLRSAIAILKPKAGGVFSQHRTAPKGTVMRLAMNSARKPQSLIATRLRLTADGTKRTSENPSIPLTIKRTDEATAIVAPYATAEKIATERSGFERFAFLAAVAVIGYVALKRH